MTMYDRTKLRFAKKTIDRMGNNQFSIVAFAETSIGLQNVKLLREILIEYVSLKEEDVKRENNY